MTDTSVADLMTAITPLLNRRVGPYIGHNPVTRTHIWQWCEAMGDDNPLYLGGERAVAPPTMMQMWTMRGVRGDHGPGSTLQNPYEILKVMEAHGYAGVMAVSYDQTFHRYIEEGEHVHHYSTIVSVSDLKTTGIGKGFFVTELAEYMDAHEQVFAEARITYFQYQVPKRAAAPAPSAPGKIQRVAPIENQDTEHFWQGLRDGKLLIQKCSGCGTLRHPPQPMCEQCQSLEWETLESKGAGTVYTYTVMHYPEIPPFDYPNAIVLVELDEGVRIASQLVGCKPDDIRIGMRVAMKLTAVQDNMTLPLFHAV